jgi:predicted permease
VNPLRTLWFRLQPFLRRRRIEAELDDEIRTHLEMAEEAHVATGLSREKARLAARREFGGVDQVKEAYRDERGVPWIESILQDVRTAVRSLRRTPGFVALTLVTLALGISLNTTAFSFLDAILLEPLPFPGLDRLVQIYRTAPGQLFGPNSPGDLFELKEQKGMFSGLAIVDFPTYSLAVSGQPAERVSAFAVSGDFFTILGVPPLLGRVFGPPEDAVGHDAVIVLSYEYWRRRFALDPGVIGRTLRMNGTPVTVIGVMPRSFRFPRLFGSRDIWKPLAMDSTLAAKRDGRWLSAIAQLKAGESLAEAQAKMTAIAARMAKDNPKSDANSGFYMGPLGKAPGGGDIMIWMIMGLAFSVLLIACANLANLQLARNSGRVREFGIRLSLGSTRPRLVRQMLTESLILSLAGAVLGVACALGVNRYLEARFAIVGEDSGFMLPISGRVLAFALLAALGTGVLFGTLPAWIASNVSPNAAIRIAGAGITSSQSRHRLRSVLVISELALTLSLIAGAGFFFQGIMRYKPGAVGWRSDHVVTARVALSRPPYDSAGKCLAFYDRLYAELAATPGVEAPIICDLFPTGGFYYSHPMITEGKEPPPSGKEPVCDMNTVTPGFFHALGIRLLRGRDFADSDRPGAPMVAIVNETMARKLWPNQDPIGRRICAVDSEQREWLEVVGVVSEIGFQTEVNSGGAMQYYRPIRQVGGNYFSIAARTTLAPEAMKDLLPKAVFRVDPDQAIYELTTADQAFEDYNRTNHTFASGLAVLGVSGLLLSALGLYGVISNLVVERTPEIGIRIAMGASCTQVVWAVMRQGARLAAVGIPIGLFGAWGMVQVLASKVPGSARTDSLMLASSTGLVLAVTFLACWLPARRAARMEPMTALRAE